jgi:hypothetical protein
MARLDTFALWQLPQLFEKVNLIMTNKTKNFKQKLAKIAKACAAKTPSTTLWEHYPVEGTANHAWTAGFLYALTQYVAGIRPLEDGFGKILIAPRLGG